MTAHIMFHDGAVLETGKKPMDQLHVEPGVLIRILLRH